MVWDSFILTVKTNDLIQELLKLQEAKDSFEYKNFVKDHLSYCYKNTNVTGKGRNGKLDANFIDDFVYLDQKRMTYQNWQWRKKKKPRRKSEKVRESINFDECVKCLNWDF